ncbi:MAG: hypothetical protein AB7F79_08480 [Steroidobacteraceae bacterium]
MLNDYLGHQALGENLFRGELAARFALLVSVKHQQFSGRTVFFYAIGESIFAEARTPLARIGQNGNDQKPIPVVH